MGLFGSLIELISAAVKIAVTPIAILKDVADTLDGNPKPSETKKLVKSATEDIGKAINEII